MGLTMQEKNRLQGKSAGGGALSMAKIYNLTIKRGYSMLNFHDNPFFFITSVPADKLIGSISLPKYRKPLSLPVCAKGYAWSLCRIPQRRWQLCKFCQQTDIIIQMVYLVIIKVFINSTTASANSGIDTITFTRRDTRKASSILMRNDTT